MRVFSSMSAAVLLLVGAVVVAGVIPILRSPVRPDSPESMSFWEAAGRGLVTVTVVNETYQRNGETVPQPVGIQVNNAADIPVEVSEEALLMSPHPLGPPTDPSQTTQDAILTVRTIPAGGSVLYSYGEEVIQGFRSEPAWWCSEKFQFVQAEIPFRIGGETLPFALRDVVAKQHYKDGDDNTQVDVWTYLRTHPTVVVGKEPLWTRLDGSAGQPIDVTIEATNIAVFTFEDGITDDVNVTHGAIEDDVPAGWSVEVGSYSTPPDDIVDHDDGSRTLRWFVDLPAALESDSNDPMDPTPYETVTRSYTLVSPALDADVIELPRARSDIDSDGSADAVSAPPVVEIRRIDAVAQASFRIEMAGEKWHDFNFTISSDAGVVASMDLVRRPGGPRTQAATTDMLTFSLAEHPTATLTYTPQDDPVNGRPAGDNPAWIVVVLPDGQEWRMSHNFNTQRPATWTWSVDLAAFFCRTGVTFRAGPHDAGSDDLFASWDFGDGTSAG